MDSGLNNAELLILKNNLHLAYHRFCISKIVWIFKQASGYTGTL